MQNRYVRATGVRYRIVAISMLMAFSLYLDRVCLGEIVKSESFLSSVDLTKEEIGRFLGAFFFTYALFQVPAGWVSDRFGARRMLTGYILAWSLLTALTGFATSFVALLLARLGCGIAQAGAYPTSGGIVRRWFRLENRGRASALVALGGRLGGTLAPFVTAVCIASLGSWRVTLWAYGGTGVLIAIAYWWIVRDCPDEHPSCNDEEKTWIGRDEDGRRTRRSDILPMLTACTASRSLWLNSLEQFCTNIGWAFLITWLPTYLKETKQVPSQEGALMVTLVLAMGMVGQLIGGFATDWSVRAFGLRWGRVLPISGSCLIAGLSYFACLALDSVWGIVACCALVSLMTDLGVPSIWAFMQDVGGRNTGGIYGWANMWGNLGAAASAVMVPWLMKYGDSDNSGQSLVFLACGSAFLVGGVAALGMDATKSLVPPAPTV